MPKKIAFIGGGNMARAIITGMLRTGFNAADLCVVDRNEDKREHFRGLGACVSDRVEEFLPTADILVLAIKPQGARDVCRSLGEGLADQSPLVISLMAGITLAKLNEWMGEHLTVVRSAPNTPATIQLGATGLFADVARIATEQRADVESIMGSIGKFAWLEREEQMNAITALSGSGPAYYFYFIEQMTKAAVDLGLPPEIAMNFSIETAFGAASLARESAIDVVELRRQVTSKKGTTEAAIRVMDEGGTPLIFRDALRAAYTRAEELSEEAADGIKRA